MSTSWVTAAREVPGLDHDPCPGDVPGVRRMAGDLRVRADGLRRAVTACRGWEPAGWTGRAADAARPALTGLGDRLDQVGRSMEEAGDALDAWASELGRLQDEAAALGELALDNRRRRLAASVRVVPGGPLPAAPLLGDAADLIELERERRDIQQRAEALHRRWVADGRRAGAALDTAAPRSATGWWRGSWDLAHDRYRAEVRQQARGLSWQTGVLDVASAVCGVVAFVPPAAPVAVPLALGLGLGGAAVHATLAVGADGSPEPAVIGLATLGAGAAVRVATRAVGGASAASARAADAVADVSDGGLATEDVVGVAAGAVQRRSDVARHGTVTDLAGTQVPVVVHDVEEPWHVGHGLSGAGFAGVATVPVPTPATGGPVVRRPADEPTPVPRRHVRGPRRPVPPTTTAPPPADGG